MAGPVRRRNSLLPWWIGFAIILAAVVYVAYQFICDECSVPTIVPILVVGVIPVIYLGLMYLTFKSEEDYEKHKDDGEYDPRSGRG